MVMPAQKCRLLNILWKDHIQLQPSLLPDNSVKAECFFVSLPKKHSKFRRHLKKNSKAENSTWLSYNSVLRAAVHNVSYSLSVYLRVRHSLHMIILLFSPTHSKYVSNAEIA